MATLHIAFRGRAAHVGSANDRGINALDALLQLFNAMNAMHRALPWPLTFSYARALQQSAMETWLATDLIRERSFSEKERRERVPKERVPMTFPWERRGWSGNSCWLM